LLRRIKRLSNTKKQANFYFWRTYDQKEIDLIEEKDGKLNALEFKFGDGKIPTATKSEFLKAYPQSEFKLISRENLDLFL